MTISELFQECWNSHWNSPRYQLSGHAKEVQNKYKNHIKPIFGGRDYLEIKRSEVRDWNNSMISMPVTANRSIEILSKLYKFAQDKEWTEGFNPCAAIKHFVEKKRRRYASEREIKIITDIMDKYAVNHPVEMGFLYTLLYTGARPRSIERARYDDLSEIENDFGVLTFEGKSTEETGDLESVILPPIIMALIRNLPRRTDNLIFGIPLPSYLWRKIRKEAGSNDLWARDLRRTFATIGMSGGVKIDTIGELLNHHSTTTTKRYALLNNKARLEAVNQISNKLKSIIKK